MGDYFVPLSVLLPLPSFVRHIPVIGTVYPYIGVRDLRDRWNDQTFVVTGDAVVLDEVVIGGEWGGLVLGSGSAGETIVRFEVAAARLSIASLIIGHGEEYFGLEPSVIDGEHGAVRVFWEADGPCLGFRLAIHDLTARLRLPPGLHLGELIEDAGQVVGIERFEPPRRVEVSLPSASLVFDTERGISIALDPSAAVNVPPFVFGETGIGLQVLDLKVDLSRDQGIPELLSRPNFDESWRGLYLNRARLLGLDNLLPVLPSQIELHDAIIDSDGVSGVVEATLPPDAPFLALALDAFSFELERSVFIRGTVETTLHWDRLNSDWAAWHPLRFLFTIRHNPAMASALDSLGFDIAVASTQDDTDGLLHLGRSAIAAIEGGLCGAVLLATGLTTDPALSPGQVLVAGLLAAASVLQTRGALRIEEIDLTKVTGRYFTEMVNGHKVRFIDLALDLRLRLSIDIDLPGPPIIVPTIKTERPIGLELRGLTLRASIGGQTAGVKALDIVFDPSSGISFDVGDQTLIAGSPLVIAKAGLGSWDGGIWVDVGVKVNAEMGEVAVSVVPSVVRLWFRQDGTFDHVSFSGLSFSVLVPQLLHAKGQLEWGDPVRLGTGRAYLLRKDYTASADERSSWLWDLEVALREETRDGLSSTAVSLEVTNADGWKLSPTIALYGLSMLLGRNTAPAVTDREHPDYVQWYRELPPRNRISALKWGHHAGGWAGAFGAILGSAPDGGRAWSAKAAIIYAPGVLIIPGSLNLLTDRPKLADDRAAAFGMVLAFDWEHDIYAASITIDYVKPEDGKLLRIHVPIDFYSSKSPKTLHLYVGEHMPVAKRVLVKVLGRFDGSFYLMIDRNDIADLGGHAQLDIPGTAIVLGGAAGFDWQFGSGRIKLFFRAGFEVHLALGSLGNSGDAGDATDGTFFGGLLHLTGAVGLKVFGMGFELGLDASMIWMTPAPKYFDLAVSVSIGLPWPLPDIDAVVRYQKGADGLLPAPGRTCAALTLHPRARHAPVEVVEGQTLAEVPIDPAFTLTFTYPTRNATGTVGAFHLDGVDTQVHWPMSDDKGYAFELVELALAVEQPDGTRVPVTPGVPALWFDTGEPGPGGQRSRKTLQLFAYDGPLTSRYIGGTADYIRSIAETFDPCPGDRPRPVCYRLDGLPGGDLANGIVVAGDPPVTLRCIPAPEGAETLRRLLARDATGCVRGGLAAELLRGVLLPTTYGLTLPGAATEPILSASLRMDWRRAHRAVVSAYRDGRRARVIARFFDGDTLVLEDASGVVVGNVLDRYDDVRFVCSVPSTRVELAALQQVPDGAPLRPLSETYEACLTYEDHVRDWQDSLATADAWSQLWSDLLVSNAATSDALLLEPGTTYVLDARVRWSQVQGNQEMVGGTEVRSFRFRTVAADQPPLERLRTRAQAVAAGAWEVDTTPADGAPAHYRDRGVTLHFLDPRTDARYRKFGRRLVLRLVDDRGQDLFDRLAFLADHGAELPEYQELWRDVVLGTGCTDPGVASLWAVGVAHFGSLLALGTGYRGDLVPVPDPTGSVDLATVDWASLPSLHTFHFRTSRWPSLAAHLAAHQVVDELLERPLEVATLGPAVPQVSDAAVAALLERLELPPRPPAREPEIVRVWNRGSSAGAPWSVIALLIDGPEPVLRHGVQLAAASAVGGVTIAIVAALSRSRALVLFTAGAGVGVAPVGPLVLTVSDGTESATMTLVVSTAPAVLAEELPP